VKEQDVRDELAQLSERLAPRGLILREVAGGFRIGTAPDLSGWVAKLKGVVRPPRLSPPALETMAVIAYRQPISRAEVEAVRGVDCSGTLDTLVERGIIRITGRSEAPGRPILYGTTSLFLEHFGLKDLEDLPNSEELRRVKLPAPADPSGPQQEELIHEASESAPQS
jgi:segregation and condensation protein B